ncbi:MAG: hypothetical protein HN443_07370 [Flavobacteriaceae bacterium]|nr:hypothetical protein [Flavobacteriaceae bacterium]
MKNLLRLFSILLLLYGTKNSSKLLAQTVVYETQLPKKIEETSGIAFFKKDFLTHNDSGGKPSLYRFNEQGDIINKYRIEGAENSDWEDIAQDKNYLYIADSGNNNGKRKTLNIQIIDPRKNFKKIGIITFDYREQQSFEKRNKHPFDAEALIATQDVLVLFSKNRKNYTTELYSIPKTSGNYTLSSKKSFDVQSLITGADYHNGLKLVALVGYIRSGEQFLYTLSSFDMDNLNQVKMKKFKLPLDGKQIEAIKIIDQNNFWITSEGEELDYPMLYKIKL